MDEKKKEYTRFSVSIPTQLYEEFEQMRIHLDITRSDAIRTGMRLHLKEQVEHSDDPSKIEILGSISYLEKAHVHRYDINPESRAESTDQSHEHHDEHPHSHLPLDKPGKDSDSNYYLKVQQEFIKINDLQHNFLHEIISTTHIHAGPEKCMIIIAVKGNLQRINLLMDNLKTFKTIENLKFIALESKSA